MSSNFLQTDLVTSPTRSTDSNDGQPSRPKLLLRGIDTLEVSHFVNVGSSKLDFADLAAEQQRAKQSRKEGFVELSLGGEAFALRPYGRFPYTYVLSNEDLEVRLAEHMKPACLVRFSSKALWTQGLDSLASRFDRWCQSLELAPARVEAVSRADWAFDYQVAAVDFAAEHFVSRATKDAQWREHMAVQTFQFGKGQLVIRLYDKIAEITQQSEKAFFFDLWGCNAHVWRVEFQVRSERLREAGITTLDDLRTVQNDLLREIAENHTSLRLPTQDTNRARWPLHPLWKGLRADIETLPQTGLVRAYDPASTIEDRLYQQTKSVYGHLKGIAALLVAKREAKANPRLDQVLRLLERHLRKHHHQDDIWDQDIEARLKGWRLGQW